MSDGLAWIVYVELMEASNFCTWQDSDDSVNYTEMVIDVLNELGGAFGLPMKDRQAYRSSVNTDHYNAQAIVEKVDNFVKNSTRWRNHTGLAKCQEHLAEFLAEVGRHKEQTEQEFDTRVQQLFDIVNGSRQK
jgi:hypothetical protein